MGKPTKGLARSLTSREKAQINVFLFIVNPGREKNATMHFHCGKAHMISDRFGINTGSMFFPSQTKDTARFVKVSYKRIESSKMGKSKQDVMIVE